MTACAGIEICLTSGPFVGRYSNATFTVFCSTQYRQALKSSEGFFGGDFLDSLVGQVTFVKGKKDGNYVSFV